MEDSPRGLSGGGTEMEKPVCVEQIKEETLVILDDDTESSGTGDGGGDNSLHSTIPVPRPMEGLHELGPTPFLKKMYQMVEDPETIGTISWNPTGKSFIIWDDYSFSCDILPKYFKHNNFSSFIRQLNTYGFKKIHPDRWEFANEGFQKGKKDLLKTIKRKKHSSQTARQEGSGRHFDQTNLATEAEIETLRHDGKEIRTEIKKLKEQQENAEFHLAAIRERIVNAEIKHQQLLVFVSKAFTSPAFLGRFVQFLRQKKELCNGHIAKKPRLGDAQNQEELTTVDSEVVTLFSDSLDDDDNHNLKDDATPGLDFHDLSSENYTLWEKLITDDLIIEHEAETEENMAQDPSKIVKELKSLIQNYSMGGHGKDMVELVG